MNRSSKCPPVDDALDVGERNRGGRVCGKPVEVVGRCDGGGVAGRDGPTDTHPGLAGVVEEAADEVPALAGNGDAALGRVGRDDLGAQAHRRAHQALSVGSGQKDAQLVGQVDQLGLCPTPLGACLAVTRAGEEGRLHPLGGASPQQGGVGTRWSAHEHEVDLTIGQRLDVCDGAHAEHLFSAQVGAEHRTSVAVGEDVVQADEAELPRVAAGAGHQYPAGLEQCAELLVGGSGAPWSEKPGRLTNLHKSIHGHGLAVGAHDQGVDVDTDHVGSCRRQSGKPEQHATQGVTVHLGVATEWPQQSLRGQSVDHLVGVGGDDGDRAELDVGDRLSEHSPNAEHHVGTELGVADDSCDELAVAPDHRCHEERHFSVGRGGLAEQPARRSLNRGDIGEPERYKTALGLVGDRRATELHHDREPDLGGRGPCGLGIANLTLGGQGYPEVSQQGLRLGFGEGVRLDVHRWVTA